MKTIFYFLFISVLIFISCSNNENNTKIDKFEIVGNWKFKTGDNIEWSANNFDDSKWDTLNVAQSWESQMNTDYDGIAWYRKNVNIPLSIKSQLSSEYMTINICLGMIDDADEVYFNGKQIGHTGSITIKDGSAYSINRKYTVHAKDVKWGSENSIAVKVMDHGGRGGMYQGPYEIFPTSWIDYTEHSIEINGFEGVISKDEELVITGNLNNNSKDRLKGKTTCIIKTDTHEEVARFEQSMSVKVGKNYSVNYTYKPKEAGFYQAIIKYNIQNKDTTLIDSIYFGYDPSNLKSNVTRPDDFDEYWAKARKELNAIDPQFEITFDKDKSTKEVNVYEVEMSSLGNARVRGWYTTPKNLKGKYPALLKNVGYSGNNQPVIDRTNEGFVVFALNIRGHGNSKGDINPGFPQYISTNIDDKEKYIYRGAYMDCIRAIDFLCAQNEVDTSRIGVFGGSQGGALSFATAALDNRIKLCAPHVPYLSDFREHYKIVPLLKQKHQGFLDSHPNTTWNDMYKTLDYIDIGNLAPWINVPVFMGVGLADRRCPPHINFAAFNRIASADKQWFVYQGFGHSVPGRHHQAELDWFKDRFDVKK